jgi:putative transposase
MRASGVVQSLWNGPDQGLTLFANSLIGEAKLSRHQTLGLSRGSIRASAEHLGAARTTVRNWRRRWLATKEARVAERLADAPHPGAPALDSAEQACAIIALAGEDPCASTRAITHWTQRELADEAIKRSIVPDISQRSVGRMLKRG